MPVRGLVLIAADPGRVGLAMEIAAAQAALGGAVRVFCHGPAVAALATPDARFDAARDLGVRIVACQTGLADAGLDLATLDPGIEAGGLVSLLSTLGDDRLTIV